MGLKAKVLLLILVFTFILTGCNFDFTEKELVDFIDDYIEKLSEKENIVFVSNTTITRNDEIASASLKGVKFLEANQIYYLGNASGHRLELYYMDNSTYIRASDNKWTSLEAVSATEIEPFINDPIRLLEFAKYGQLELMESTVRINRRNHYVVSGAIDRDGIIKYLDAHIPDFDSYDEVFIETSLYIDESSRTLSRIDLFINEYSGEFSLVTEMIIEDYNISTDITPPK